MTPESFFRHVERLRAAQREYFRTRSSSALTDSKRMEREIERVNRLLSERQNPKLNFNLNSDEKHRTF